MRVRNTGYTAESGTVVAHATIDSGPGTVQTAVTFRAASWGGDILTVHRPNPRTTFAAHDRSDVMAWRG